ncbi:hypothetical protein [Martelella mediterranea]|uniref:hypothetical protein n=1 Tax=Martelella mediterranea TaxID=293089 RepID=UPI00104BC8FC|nr:hypothetical protein [Martelella mediterranea]
MEFRRQAETSEIRENGLEQAGRTDLRFLKSQVRSLYQRKPLAAFDFKRTATHRAASTEKAKRPPPATTKGRRIILF